MKNYDIMIGIDPDSKASGVAEWDTDAKSLNLRLMTFPELVEHLFANRYYHVFVRIEAGWLVKKSNFHGGNNRAIGERIAAKVGANHETGKKIAEMCESYGIAYELVKPLGKVTPVYFTQVTGNKTKNQELIDAAMLVYGHSGAVASLQPE